LALAIINFALLMLQGTLVLGVPFTGSLLAMTLAAVLYVIAATAFGLVISAFTRSQIAALFGTAILTMMPAVQFAGMIDPVSSLDGLGRFIGTIYPTTHFITVSRGAFAKGLGLQDLQSSVLPLLLAIPVLLALAAAVTRKQER
jgi:ribosome-dependent ATPase